MSIDVHFFASLSERLGKTQVTVDAADVRTAEDVWRRAVGDDAPVDLTSDRVLVAINQEYAKVDAPVADGDEVAFFPPVTGG